MIHAKIIKRSKLTSSRSSVSMCATEYFWNGKSLIILCNNARIILWTCGIRPKRLRIAGANVRESKPDLNNIMYGRMKAENIVHDACVMSAQGYA